LAFAYISAGDFVLQLHIPQFITNIIAFFKTPGKPLVATNRFYYDQAGSAAPRIIAKRPLITQTWANL
jgi:hypothetical protein